MRKIFGILSVLLALTLLSGCGSQPAADNTVTAPVDYPTLFQRAVSSDGSGQSGSAVDDPSLFNEETIRGFVTRHDYTSGPDESFFTLLADVYRQDPETLAAAVEGLDDSQLDYIARGIAYDIINHGKDTPGKEPDTSDPFIAMVEAAIADKRNGDLNSFSS